MALKKDKTIELIYKNDRLQNDSIFAQMYPNLSAIKEEVIEVNNAYCAIELMDGNKDLLSFAVTVYVDETKQCVLSREHYTFVPDVSTEYTPNFYTQAYEYLKTLAEYANAVDC